MSDAITTEERARQIVSNVRLQAIKSFDGGAWNESATVEACDWLLGLVAEVERLQDENALGKKALDRLTRDGYRKCDIAACNCGDWHGGNASNRLRELHDALGSLTNGVTLLDAVDRLRARNDALEKVAKAAEGLLSHKPAHDYLCESEVYQNGRLCDCDVGGLRLALSALNHSETPNSSGGET